MKTEINLDDVLLDARGAIEYKIQTDLECAIKDYNVIPHLKKVGEAVRAGEDSVEVTWMFPSTQMVLEFMGFTVTQKAVYVGGHGRTEPPSREKYLIYWH
jgi:hypothetical protein